ncbi:HDOD domain-containing protein [Geoalkalibacter halelectricus]|uniref:HDOD domain-containing protein n=1 Tax=Geoalkalibacter halelectricus TaxID=2847045 RepID=A0ABY5ZI47_9BACT|nr:HDOD domain-containing protein [Geoalkalibacter halelectricus]MDO3378090.1 HDOD domain-containing protein [Geoalkalibacter halelectricus]UWZ78386.1 HDOD domain-containing protein [Geoalkalibacter halelectricus]
MATRVDRQAILETIQKAPMLSPSASRLLQITAARDHEMAEVIAVVRTDAHLTARVLKTVNSAAFGLLYEITSIDRAVNYLGERMVVGIAIGDCAAQLFQKPLDGYESEKGSLWRHDLLTAIAAREVAGKCKTPLNPDLAFTAGLLHDIGKALISDFLKGTAPDLLRELEEQLLNDYLEGERAALGIDHPEAGAELAAAWRLPHSLQAAILHHHAPQQAPAEQRALVYAVHLGDIIAMMAGCGTGTDSLRYRLDPKYSDYFALSQDELFGIILEADAEFQKITHSMAEAKEKPV